MKNYTASDNIRQAKAALARALAALALIDARRRLQVVR